MNRKKMMGLLGALALCLMCLWAAGGSVRAAEPKATESPAKEREVSYEEGLRYFVKNDGKKYFKTSGFGKSGYCYYTYVGKKKEVEIIGFEETVREIRIPDKIKGKKVKRIDIWGPEMLDFYTDVVNQPKIRHSRTMCVVLSKYINTKNGVYLQDQGALSNLERIKVSPQNKTLMAKDGVLFSKDGKTLWEYPDKRKTSSYKIPKGVVKLGAFAFEHALVEKVVMPDTVKSIGDWCFAVVHSSSPLKSVRLSKNLKRIGKDAFSGTHLKKISLPEGLEVIQMGAFSETDIKKLSLPGNLKSIGRGAFSGTDIREVVIPGNVKRIPAGCFSSCKKLKKVTIKKGVKEIGESAFTYCYQLRKLVIPSSVKSIADPFAIDHHYEGDEPERNREAWHKAGVTIYAKKESHAYRKFSKKYWMEKLGIKVKAM